MQHSSYQQAKEFVDYILPKVSRTFALNIKVLRGQDYDFVACAYLICRTIDTIEDSPHTPSEKKIEYLNLFYKVFKKSFDPSGYDGLIKKMIPTADNEAEKELLEKFKLVMVVYHQLDDEIKNLGLEPILEMAEGMAAFIAKYAGKKEIVLKTEKEMEQYCYYVAGTVGNLLTALFTLRISNLQAKNTLEANKISFGLGLQMTNIAKDFQRDGKRGWTYIPESYLKDEKISRNDFLSGEPTGMIAEKTKKIHLRFVNKAVDNLDASLKYTKAIPVSGYRYRLFCFIPLFLAIKTISFIKKQKIDATFNDKISKKDVYLIILYSYLSSLNNSIAEFVYNRLKK